MNYGKYKISNFIYEFHPNNDILIENDSHLQYNKSAKLLKKSYLRMSWG